MEPDIPQPPQPLAAGGPGPEPEMPPAPGRNHELPPPEPAQAHRLRRVFIGPDGLRAGWSVLLFVAIMAAVMIAIGFVLGATHLVDRKAGFTPQNMFFNELDMFLGLLGAAWAMARIERRNLLDYNLRGPRRPRHFFSGLVIGFAALSALVGSLSVGKWLRFGPVALSGAAIAEYAAIWGAVFLLVGCVEEGTFRCYLQFTFTRGLNFWWALGINAALCLELAIRAKGNGVWGDYVVALLGVVPCYLLHQKAAARGSFWQAAWVTSTLFGFVHTGNGGENWVGIFSAAAIGFAFCVSIRVTGSAWWAIGCHAGWDWAETYFYGTADSGFVAKGHLLTTTAAGNPMWSGGADGPEGSLLILGILVLLIVWLVVVYGRGSRAAEPGAAPEAWAGERP
ncbi:MAG: CPBP family intramembrane glutamic endopeptidase [Acidobacteriota bacterium]